MQKYNEAVQFCIDAEWEHKTYNKNLLHKITYSALRQKISTLQSSLIQCARDQASDILRRQKFLGTKATKNLFGSIRYNARTYTPRLMNGMLSISTIDGRKRYSFTVPNYYGKYLDWKVRGMTLSYKDGSYFANIIVKKEYPIPNNASSVLGIDLGINKIAVCSDNVFFSSKLLKRRKGEYAYLRRKLQQKGTRSARRLLKRIGGRENRFVADVNHRISKEIVGKDFDVFVLEKLSIRRHKRLGKAFNRKLGTWSYGQLQRFITYKAEEAGKQTVFVNPAHTSQMCSCCGLIDSSARQGSRFSCEGCGKKLDADLNAARNIAQRGISVLSRLPVGQPNAMHIDTKCL